MSTEKKLLRIKQNKSDRRIARKICKMIRRDEFRKLNSFIDGDTNSVVHPDSVLNRRGMTGLMISCKLGHPDCLNVFLRHGASKNLTCFKGNKSLHTFILKTLLFMFYHDTHMKLWYIFLTAIVRSKVRRVCQ